MARIVVGECSSCGRPLRVKTKGVKGTLNLTCRCGTRTRIEVTHDLRSAALEEEQIPVSSQQSIRLGVTGGKAPKTGRNNVLSGIKKRLYNCKWLLSFFLMYWLGFGGLMLLDKLGILNDMSEDPPAIFFIGVLFACTGLIGSTFSAYNYAGKLHRDGGRWGLFVFLFAFIAPLILAVVPASGFRFSSLYKADTDRDQVEGKRVRCRACRKRVEGLDALMASQVRAVRAGLTQKARDMEKDQGYVCQSCANIYCKVCLEGRIINPQAGASCPDCGGSFGYLP
jgi:hypothetical protein